tara:strand:- start:1069 stop:1374 length:306 start_codon:yes stop_codon:yes gene_type:complete
MTENKVTLVMNAIINKENMSELPNYMEAMWPIMAQNNATLIGKYKGIDQIVGEQGPEIIGIFQFENADAIKNMVNGEEFKGLASLRARVFSKLNMTICSEM